MEVLQKSKRATAPKSDPDMQRNSDDSSRMNTTTTSASKARKRKAPLVSIPAAPSPEGSTFGHDCE